MPFGKRHFLLVLPTRFRGGASET